MTETLSLQHGVMNSGETDKTFDYVIESTLGVDWTVYAGTYDEPNLEQPIGSQIVAPPGGLYFWLISGALNGTTPAGSHSVELTLTDTALPEDSQLAVDAIWVGEAPGYASNPFLPLIVR